MQSESIAKLAAAIAKAQSEMKPVKKDTINPFFGKKYADLASVWDSMGPFFANGIAITQSAYTPERPGYVGIETQLTHISGEWKRERLELPVVKQDPQGFGSALTYCRRYSLMMTGVVTEEDDDGNAASQPQAKPSAVPAARAANAKKMQALQTPKKDTPSDAATPLDWDAFLDYAGDDPDRMNVIAQLKEALAIGMVSDLQGEARISFIKEFQQSCKDTGVPCQEWVKL